MRLNLASLLRNSTRRYPQLTAAIDGEPRLTYAELDEAARRFAGELLASGLEPGDKVAVMTPNVPAFTIAYFGILYAGGVVIPLNSLLVAGEVAFQLEDGDARALVVHDQCADVALDAVARVPNCRLVYAVDCATRKLPQGTKQFEEVIRTAPLADLPQTSATETAVILYTSGTTGKPKGAELTHGGLYYNAQVFAERVFSRWPERIRVLGPGDVGLAVLPLYHAFGQTNIQNGVLFSGGTVSYMSRFSAPAASRAIIRDRVTLFAGVPTMYIALLDDPEVAENWWATIKYCVSGGAALPVDVKQRLFDRFRLPVQEGYGLTETSPLACIQSPTETARCGSIGKPVIGVEMKIFDDQDRELPPGEHGEIVIRGHNIMKGYFKRPEATADAMRNGWFHSGDIGYVDEDGDFHIVDRKKELIIRGGFNVYPREVEEALYSHPAVAEAAVIGIPDPRLGEEVQAVIALRPGTKASADEIIAHCRQLVAAYKYPRIVKIIDSLPKGPTGKILKRALRET